MLPKDLLRATRSGGDLRPSFVDDGAEPLASRVIETYRTSVGEPRSTLEERLSSLETEAGDFKLVRGLATLVERTARFEVRSPLDPVSTRRTVFAAAEEIGVATESSRDRAIEAAADRLDAPPSAVETALYADRREREILVAVGEDVEGGGDLSPRDVIDRYNRALAATALLDATEATVRSSDPKGLVRAVKRLGLLYEVRRTPDGRVLEVTGPDALFRHTTRYGRSFARLLDAVVRAERWRVVATVDDRGTRRTLRLDETDPVAPPSEDRPGERFDSGVEADFAARFEALDLAWDLRREPEPLETGTRVMIPDFAFEYRHEDFRLYFEIMGYWTPEYVRKKLAQLEELESVDLLVAVDESLGVGEAVEDLGHGVIRYRDRVRLKDVVAALRTHEDRLIEAARRHLPDALTPEEAVITLTDLAARHGVGERAIDSLDHPEHDLVGRTLVRPSALEALGDELETGMHYEAVGSLLADRGFDPDDLSPVLARLGYRVPWDGLAPGPLERVPPAND